MWEAGVPLQEIADRLDTTRNTVGVALARMRRAGWQLSYRRNGYAAVPFEHGSWDERLAALAKQRTGHSSRLPFPTTSLASDPCSYCGGLADTIDHIDPRALGGLNSPENVTAACKSCNSQKHKLPLLHFLLWKRIREDIRGDLNEARWLRSSQTSLTGLLR